MSEDQEEHIEGSTDVPLEDAQTFRILRRLTLNSMSRMIPEAAEIQAKIDEAKTKPKKDLYQKKFNKLKREFQDEIARLTQLEHTMKENGISLDEEEKGEDEIEGEQQE